MTNQAAAADVRTLSLSPVSRGGVFDSWRRMSPATGNPSTLALKSWLLNSNRFVPGTTFYARHGDVFAWSCLALAAALTLRSRVPSRELR